MMSIRKNKVASFEVDHTALESGIYLRSIHNGILSWDLRMRSPRERRPMTPGAVHVIEHILADGFRNIPGFGDRVIAICPMGCLTGFYLITESDVEERDVASAITRVAHDFFPLLDKNDVPGMNEVQCGNPSLADLDGANSAMREYIETINWTSDKKQYV